MVQMNIFTLAFFCWDLANCCEIITFKKKIMVKSSDFKSIVDTLGFVDKSSLIKEVLKGSRFKVITAPRRFGKSSNLDMLRTFLTLPVEPLVGTRLQTIVSANLELFKNLRIYKDDPDFVLNTLGTFPVINVDFGTKKTISTKKECVEILSFKIHQSFLSHKYLCSSSQLSEREKGECNTWCSESYKTQGEEDVIEGLARLAAFLHKHHNHTVITLIDDFDSLVTAATIIAPDKDLQSVVCFIMKIFSTLINKNQSKWRAIITGSSVLPTVGTPKLDRYVFLGNHSLDGFYGFTEEEVERLLDNPEFHLDPEEIRRAYKMYCGYKTKRGTVLYCTHSFLRFLLIGKSKPYWEPSVYVESLMNAYSIPAVEEIIDNLLKDKSIGFLLPEQVKLSEFLNIRKIAIKKCSIEPPNLVLFLLHLLELGYLTYYVPEAAPNQMKTYLKLPNGEVKSVILEYLWNIQVFSNLSNQMEDEDSEEMVE